MVPLDELKDYPRTSRWRRFIAPALIGLALAVALFFLLQPTEESRQDKRLGSFELPLLGGGTLSDEDLRGKPVVLNFFASWCTPCREEADLLQNAYEEYGPRGVQFIGVNVEDTPEKAKDFVNEFGITYPVVKDYDLALVEDLDTLIGWPQTFFVTGDLEVLSIEAGEKVGTINGTTTLGAIDKDQLDAGIEALLEAG